MIQSAYQRVNLRDLAWETLLARALWPLVTLALVGASEAAVHSARDAIEGRANLSPAARADHLAVLCFVAEAEDPPRAGHARIHFGGAPHGKHPCIRARWRRARRAPKRTLYAETLVRVRGHRLGALDPAVRERIRAVTDLETLKLWHDEVLFLNDAEAAQRLVEKIRNAPLG